jgi:hypothetical protein
MNQPIPIQQRIAQARRQAAVCHSQAVAALTTLSLLDDAGPIDRLLQRRLAEDAARNLESVIRCASAALASLEGGA